jgi:hypothetical protein
MTPSMRRCTPMFFRAEPREHGVALAGEVPLRIAALDLLDGDRALVLEVPLHQVVVELDGLLDQRVAPLGGLVGHCSGISFSVTVAPMSSASKKYAFI